MTEVFEKIEQWAHDRNLVEGSTQQAQLGKLIEEIGELAKGINKKQQTQIIDGIGDAVVVLTILAMQIGWTLEGCATVAYCEIKDRKGKMIDGVFVKESDFVKQLKDI